MNMPSLGIDFDSLLPDLDPDMIQTLGWTLIHFLWEGLALALLFQGLITLCRTANARYNLAFATLGAMALAPVMTFAILDATYGAAGDIALLATTNVPLETSQALGAADGAPASPLLNGLVVLWFIGVAALSLRVAGGWYVADSLRRRDVSPLPPALRARFERLRSSLGISRPVQFLQSAIVNAPAVVGWLRPVVLIPISAVVGLSPAQLEAVIVHELAHIRRFDALANLLQMAVETMLFYHPAVWWISRRIRVEREHCCDDVAVNMSGDALDYAKALASLEEWRGLPLPALAANGGVLKHRISRLLGLNIRNNGVSVMGVAGVGLVCLVGCVVAHGADVDANAATAMPFPGLALVADAPPPLLTPVPLTPVPLASLVPIPAPAPAARPSVPPVPAEALAAAPAIAALPALPAIRIRGEHYDHDDADDAAERMRDMQREVARETAERAREQAQEARDAAREARDRQREAVDEHTREMERGRHPGAAPKAEDASYVAALEAAGLKNLDADDVLGLKSMGVTADYVREIAAAGYNPRPRLLMAFKAQGIDGAYIKDLRAAGVEPGMSQIIAFKSQGIKAAFIKDIHAVWPDAGPSQIIALQSQNVTPDYVRTVRAGWPDVSVNDMIALSTMGVKAADAAEYKKSGAPDLSIKQLVSYKTLGVTPEYVRTLKAAGIKDLSVRDFATAKVRGITPEFLDAVRKHGFSNLTMRQLIALKDADVL